MGNHSSYLKSLLRFSLAAFWPVGLFLLFLVQGLLVNFVIMACGAAVFSWQFLIGGVLFTLLPLAIVTIAHRFCSCAVSWKVRGFILYLSWSAIALMAGFVLAAGLGGVSMAVAEGVAGSLSSRYFEYAAYAVYIAAWSQVVYVPWTLLSILILKRMNRNQALWADKSEANNATKPTKLHGSI